MVWNLSAEYMTLREKFSVVLRKVLRSLAIYEKERGGKN